MKRTKVLASVLNPVWDSVGFLFAVHDFLTILSWGMNHHSKQVGIVSICVTYCCIVMQIFHGLKMEWKGKMGEKEKNWIPLR